MKMPTQLWLSEENALPTSSQLGEVKNSESLHWKPQGGIWTSTYRDGRSEWWEWCEGEGFGDYRSAWLLEPIAAARILTVATPDDLIDATRKYGREIPDSFGGLEPSAMSLLNDGRLDYEKIADDYDGMWIPNPRPYRLAIESLFFNVMDVESTVWFRWMFSNAEKLDLPSPHKTCGAVYSDDREMVYRCMLEEGHEEMHKAGYFHSFSWRQEEVK